MYDNMRIEKHTHDLHEIEIINKTELISIAMANGYQDSIPYLFYLMTVKDKIIHFPNGHIEATN